MIDNLSFKGRIQQVVQGIPSQFDQIALLRNSGIKLLQAKSYLNSPITAAQIEALPTVEEHLGVQWLYLTISLPVAAALVGQNMIHNGLEALKYELKCIRSLVKWVLNSYGFTPQQISLYLDNVEVQTVELTWHTATASRAAALNAQARTIAHFVALEKIKGRHDVQVADVDIWIRNSKTCMLVTFKDGSQFRQYLKAEQASSRTRNNRRACFVSKSMRQHLDVILAAIDTHLRNEVILSHNFLTENDILHPRDWTAESLESAIGRVMTMGRLNQRRVTKSSELLRDGLSPEVLATADRYLAGETIEGSVSPQLLAKHRRLLLDKGLDIAEEHRLSRSNSVSRAGLQIQYDKRWVPDDMLRDFAVGEESAPMIMQELDIQVPARQPIRTGDQPPVVYARQPPPRPSYFEENFE